MFFYKIETNLVETDEAPDRRKREERDEVFQKQAEEAFMASGQNCYIFISSEHRDKLTCGAISRSPEDIKRAMPPFMRTLGFQTASEKVSEITMKALISLANCADRHACLLEAINAERYQPVEDVLRSVLSAQAADMTKHGS